MPITTFTLTSPNTQVAAPFSIGHAFKKGDVPSSQGVVVSGANAQVTPKNYWPDGSLKFAIIAGTANTPATVTLSVGSASTGAALTLADLKATGVTASIDAGAFGSASWSGTDWDSPFEWATGQTSWVTGHRMSSWLYRKQIGTDAHLVAWLEVRLYAGGAVEILPWVENGYLLVAAPTNKSETYTFTLGGAQRFSSAIDIPNHCRTVLINGGSLSYWLGSDPAVTPKHDGAYLQSTRLAPKYRGVVANTAAVLNTLPQTYTPLQQSNHPVAMGSAGADISIGVLPQWDVLYLTSQDNRTWAGVVTNGYSFGRYGIHYRDETTNRPIKFSAYPNLVLNPGRANVVGTGASSTGSYTPVDTVGTWAQSWTVTHHPSPGFLAYLITGRFYFMEEVQFVATTHYLCNTDTNRGYSNGVFLTEVGANTVRGAAWATRTLAQAACATPDGDTPLRTEFLTSLEENINNYHGYVTFSEGNPFGFVKPFSDYSGAGDNKYMEATWQQDFFTAAYGYTLDMDLPISPAGKTKLVEFFAWKARSIIGRLGGTAPTDFLYRDAAPYTLAVAPHDAFGAPWYANWGEIYTATIGAPNDGIVGDLRGGNLPEVSSYWGNLQPAIAYAVTHGVPGAEAAHNRMVGAANWSAFAAGYDADPTWGVTPNAQATQATTPNAAISKTYSIGSGQTLYAGRSKPVTPPSGSDPAWRSAMTPLTWATIGNSPSTIDPKNDAAINPNHASLPADAPWQVGASGSRFASIMDSWSGGAYNQDTDELYCMGEGHGDGGGNQIIAVALNVDSPAWRLETWPSGAVGNKLHPESTPGTEISVNDGLESTNAYADGRPRATHTYNNLLFANGDFYIAAQGAQWSSGNSGMYTFRYDANGTRDWTKLASRGASDQSFGAGCFDSSRNCIWYFPYAGNAPVRKYDIATNTWTSTGVSFPLLNDGYSRAVYIPTLDIIVCLSYQFSNDFRVFNPASPAVHAPPISGSVPTAGRYTGVWVPELGAVVTYEGGTGFNLLTPPATTPITGTWTWSRLEAAVENAVTPSSPASNGTYGRFFYAPSLQCFGVINSTDQQLHVFALS